MREKHKNETDNLSSLPRMPTRESSDRNCVKGGIQIMAFCIHWEEQKILELSGGGGECKPGTKGSNNQQLNNTRSPL